MDPADALARIAKASGLKLQKVGANSYLLLAGNSPSPKRAVQRKPVLTAPPVEPTPAPSQGEEVIVLASKRDTPSVRFAGQWLKIDGDVFAPLGVPGTEAIEARSVGFSSTHLGAGRNKLFIRGIADSSFSGPTQSPVGQYFGDMRTTYSGPDPDLKLVDMQSVEILEGPQGTLYGSGALGGIVLLKPNTPSFDRLSGLVGGGTTVTWHGDAGYDLSGMLNAPMGSAAALRVVGYRSREGGYVDNRATGEKDVNDVDVRGARATLTAELALDWFMDVSGVGQRIHGDDSQYADEDGSGLSRSSLVDQPFSSDFTLASLVIRRDSGSVRFRSTTGASWQNVDENFDASLNGQTRQLRQHSKARALSNETRLWRPMSEGNSWLVGFSSIRHRYRVDRDIETPDGRTDLAGVENEVSETTIYGEAGLELRKGLEASLGGRFTHSELSGAGEHLSPLVLARLDDDDAERSENRFLPSASLLARPIEGFTLYARYQQGFRPGGLSIAGDTVRLYRNDRLGTAEAGFRYGRQGIDRFDLQGGATLSHWKDIQADFLDLSGLPVTDNIGDGRVWTITTNGGVRLTPDLRLEAGFAWNDGKITRPTLAFRTLAASTDDSSMEIPNIARFVARGAIDWRTSLSSEWDLEANAYARFVGKSRLGIGPHLGESQGEYVDSGLVVRIAGDRRAVSLSVTNLTDETGNRFAFGAPIASGIDQITPLRPRTIRLGLEQGF